MIGRFRIDSIGVYSKANQHLNGKLLIALRFSYKRHSIQSNRGLMRSRGCVIPLDIHHSVTVMHIKVLTRHLIGVTNNLFSAEIKHKYLQHVQSFCTSSVHSVRKSAYESAHSQGHKVATSISAAAVSQTKEAAPLVQSDSRHFRQRFIYVQTSRDLWADIPGGILLDVAYLDSAVDGKSISGTPVVLSLHDTPGSFYDLQHILEAFVKSGCRVLCPAFPGIGLTEGVTKGYNDVFSHTTLEKADFVKDFLLTVGLEKVDLLIGQGSGCYPAMRLASGTDTSDMFKSVAFLSPWPHRPFRGTRQKNLIPLLHDMWERPFYRPIAKFLSKFVPNTKNVSALQRITTAYTLNNVDFGEIGGLSVALNTKKFPRVMFFAEDDKFVEAELSYELADLMGIDSDHTYRITTHLEKGQADQFPSCLVFNNGGRNLHQSHPGIVTAVLLNLLKTVRPGFI